PTQLYETTLMMLAFWLLWRLRDHRHGTGWRFGVYLVLAGAERLLVEFVRAKDDRLLGPFTLAQATSVLLVVAGIYLMQRLRQPGLRTPSGRPAHADTGPGRSHRHPRLERRARASRARAPRHPARGSHRRRRSARGGARARRSESRPPPRDVAARDGGRPRARRPPRQALLSGQRRSRPSRGAGELVGPRGDLQQRDT